MDKTIYCINFNHFSRVIVNNKPVETVKVVLYLLHFKLHPKFHINFDLAHV